MGDVPVSVTSQPGTKTKAALGTLPFEFKNNLRGSTNIVDHIKHSANNTIKIFLE